MVIKCPECRKRISNQAISCPNCGCPIPPQSTSELQGQSQQKEANKFTFPLKLLIFIQIIFFSVVFFIPTLSASLTTVACYIAAILCVPCFVLAILCVRTSKKLPTRTGKTTGILSIIFEIPLSALFITAILFAYTDSKAPDAPIEDSSASNSEVLSETNWDTFEPLFVGDIPVGCIMVPDAKPENVSAVLKEHLQSEESFSAKDYGSKYIKKKMVIENTLTVHGCTGTAILNFDWNDTLSSIVFNFDNDSALTPDVYNQLHDEVSALIGASECSSAENGLHKDATNGHYFSCAWNNDDFYCYLDCYFDSKGKPDDGAIKFERVVSEESANLSIPSSSDSIIVDGIVVKGSYHDGDYPYVEGTATNVSTNTVKSLKIKVALYDHDMSYGKVIDTEWTYAIGAEGLAPGETTQWRVSCSKAEAIKISEMD